MSSQVVYIYKYRDSKKEKSTNCLKFKQEVKLMAFSRIACLELGTNAVSCCFGLVMHFR